MDEKINNWLPKNKFFVSEKEKKDCQEWTRIDWIEEELITDVKHSCFYCLIKVFFRSGYIRCRWGAEIDQCNMLVAVSAGG